MVEKHGDFQLTYYGHHIGANPNKREVYNGHQYFEDCAVFCERWDQSSFDPDFKNRSVEFFKPMVEKVFSRKPYASDVIRVGEREPLYAI